MLIVHHLDNSRSQRVLWLLEELELPYEIEHYRRDPKTMTAPPSLRRAHPLGKAPVLRDGDTVVAESGAILEYIAEWHGGGRFIPSPESPAYVPYRQFMHYAEGSLMPPLLIGLLTAHARSASMSRLARPLVKTLAAQMDAQYVEPQLRLHLDYLSSVLADRPWFAGRELTLADFQMSFTVEAASAWSGKFDADYPQLRSFLDRVHARPAFQRAIERGGPFSLSD